MATKKKVLNAARTIWIGQGRKVDQLAVEYFILLPLERLHVDLAELQAG